MTQVDPLDDDGALDRIRAVCLGLPGVEEAVLQDRPLFRVGRRRFAIFNGEASPPRQRWDSSGRSLHFLCDPLDRDALGQDDRFTASPHHGTRGWLAIRLDGATDWVEIEELLRAAHHQVAPGTR